MTLGEQLGNIIAQYGEIFLLIIGIIFTLAVNLYRKWHIVSLLLLIISSVLGYEYIKTTTNSEMAIILPIIYIIVGIIWGAKLEEQKKTILQKENELKSAIANAETTINNAKQELNKLEQVK